MNFQAVVENENSLQKAVHPSISSVSLISVSSLFFDRFHLLASPLFLHFSIIMSATSDGVGGSESHQPNIT